MVSPKDKLFGEKTDCLPCLRFRSPEFRRGHSEFRLETAVESDRIGKSADSTPKIKPSKSTIKTSIDDGR